MRGAEGQGQGRGRSRGRAGAGVETGCEVVQLEWQDLSKCVCVCGQIHTHRLARLSGTTGDAQ